MIRKLTDRRHGALVDEHRLAVVLGYLIHTGTSFNCLPDFGEDWLVTVDRENGEELVAINGETRPDQHMVRK